MAPTKQEEETPRKKDALQEEHRKDVNPDDPSLFGVSARPTSGSPSSQNFHVHYCMLIIVECNMAYREENNTHFLPPHTWTEQILKDYFVLAMPQLTQVVILNPTECLSQNKGVRYEEPAVWVKGCPLGMPSG